MCFYFFYLIHSIGFKIIRNCNLVFKINTEYFQNCHKSFLKYSNVTSTLNRSNLMTKIEGRKANKFFIRDQKQDSNMFLRTKNIFKHENIKLNQI